MATRSEGVIIKEGVRKVLYLATDRDGYAVEFHAADHTEAKNICLRNGWKLDGHSGKRPA